MLAHIAAMGELLVDRLHELHSPHIKEIRGLGLMVGIEMDIEVLPLVKAGYEYRVLLLNAGPNVLRLLPPVIVEEVHIAQLINALESILSEIDAA
jgi:acetylornithine/succinyldiaminopimelate/putrescine aminotransferase